MIHVALDFNNEFDGELVGKSGKVHIGSGDNSMTPYELLGGALGSCLYSTFLDIIKKMRLSFEAFKLDIEIEKRTEVPTTAKLIIIKSIIHGGDKVNEAKYNRAFKLATEHCSIFSTLSHVAEMQWELKFE